MAFQEYCSFRWFIQLLAQVITSWTVNYKTPPLPDNVTFNILSRLPPECIYICQRVCKKWLEMTSTTNFAHIHLQRHCVDNTQRVLLLQCVRKSESAYPRHDSFFSLNKKSNGKIMFKKVILDLNRPSKSFPKLYGSCNGVLLFSFYNCNSNYLLNPTTQERINIKVNSGLLCGFLFHPSKMEYYMLSRAEGIDGNFDYFLFCMESESLKEMGAFPYYSTTNQAYSNGCLYWIIDFRSNNTCDNSIMAFNAETEVLSSFPHPDKHCWPKCQRLNMCLLENNGQLLFFRVYDNEFINMWVLEDNESNIWLKRSVVHLDWDIKLYPFKTHDGYKLKPRQNISVLSFDNGELLLFWKTRGLFLYNLQDKKVTKIDLKRLKVKGKVDYICSASCYVKSLVSLKVSTKFPNSGKFPTYGQIII